MKDAIIIDNGGKESIPNNELLYRKLIDIIKVEQTLQSFESIYIGNEIIKKWFKKLKRSKSRAQGAFFFVRSSVRL